LFLEIGFQYSQGAQQLTDGSISTSGEIGLNLAQSTVGDVHFQRNTISPFDNIFPGVPPFYILCSGIYSSSNPPFFPLVCLLHQILFPLPFILSQPSPIFSHIPTLSPNCSKPIPTSLSRLIMLFHIFIKFHSLSLHDPFVNKKPVFSPSSPQ
jgi:hypothetical protein